LIPARHLVAGLAAFALFAAGCGVSPVTGRAVNRGAAASGPRAQAAPNGYYDRAAGLKGQALLAALIGIDKSLNLLRKAIPKI
jgi:hypothetical protein